MNDFYIGQKFKHYNAPSDKTIITFWSVYQIAANKITLQVLETTSKFRKIQSLVTINDFTLVNMLEHGQFEFVNDTFEIET
jgi:hypothetical protein